MIIVYFSKYVFKIKVHNQLTRDTRLWDAGQPQRLASRSLASHVFYVN